MESNVQKAGYEYHDYQPAALKEPPDSADFQPVSESGRLEQTASMTPLSPETPARTYSDTLSKSSPGQKKQLVSQLQSGYGNAYTAEVIEGVRKEANVTGTEEIEHQVESKSAKSVKPAKSSKTREESGTDKDIDKEKEKKTETKKKKAKGKKETKEGDKEKKEEKKPGAAEFLLKESKKAFKKAVRKIKTLGKNERTHKDAKQKKEEMRAAVVPDPYETQSRADRSQVEKVNLRSDPKTDIAAARKTLDSEVKRATPKTIEQVDDFKSNAKAQMIRARVMVSVTGQTGPVKQTYQDIGEAEKADPPPKSPPLPEPEDAPKTPKMAVGNQLLPLLPKEMSNFSQYQEDVERQIAEEGLDPEVLAQVDSGPLAEANVMRSKLNKGIEDAPGEIGKKEKEEHAALDKELSNDEKATRGKLHQNRKKELGQIKGEQVTKMAGEKKTRDSVTKQIKDIYKKAKDDVTKKLEDLEIDALKQFDSGQKAAADKFENTVKSDMKAYKRSRYGGYFGWTKRAKDWALGMDKLPRVKEIFEDARDTFTSEVDTLINTIMTNTANTITQCRNIIKTARDDIAKLIKPLEPGLKEEAVKAQKLMNEKLDALDKKVKQKENQMKEKLDDRREKAIKEIDKKIAQMKEEMKGIGHKAKKLLLKGALKLLKWALEKAGAPVERILGFLKKAASAFWDIVKSPGAFLANLLQALFGGFKKFKKNIVTHLKKGLLDWIFGTMGDAGITVPEDFSPASIFSLVMQILDLSASSIKKKVAEQIGEENVERVEQVWSVISTLIKEGPGALWLEIKTYVGNLKEKVVGDIREWVKTKIIIGAVEWLVGLFTPGGAILKVAKTIWKVAMFIMERIRQIIDVLEAIVSSLAEIAAGAVGKASDWIEKTLGRMVPVAIGFLASLLDLSGLSKFIRGLIDRVRIPIHIALNKLIAKIAGKFKSGVTKAKDLGKAAAQKTKEVAKKVFQWWKIKKKFKRNGETHHVYFKGEGKNAQIMMASTPWVLEDYLASLKSRTPKPKKALIDKVENQSEVINKLKWDYSTGKEHSMSKKRGEDIAKAMIKLADYMEKLGAGDERPPSQLKTPQTRSWGGDKDGKIVHARPLSIHPGALKGSIPRESSALWNEVNRRKDTYKRGHLLNHHLHGAGIKELMTPVTTSLNGQMETAYESDAKHALLGENQVLNYYVEAKYEGTHSPKRKHIKAENDLCTSIEYKIDTMKLKSGATSGKDPDGWVIDKNVVSGSLPHELPLPDTPAGIARPLIVLNKSGVGPKTLETIPGVTPKAAVGIYNLRLKLKKQGKTFSYYEDLREADGVGTETVKKLKKYSFVKLFEYEEKEEEDDD